MVDSKKIFSGKESDYDQYRPRYPAQFISFLYETVGFRTDSVIADIGSGTGIFSKQIADRGSMVFCVEPNRDMRTVAQKKLSSYRNVYFTDGDCENTKLLGHSIDFITAAQSFHWFHVEKFRWESLRILKPKGKAVLVWNRRDDACAVNQKTAEVFRKYCPDFHGFGGGLKKDETGIEQYFGGKFHSREFRNDLFYDRDAFIGRNLSGSYAIGQNDGAYKYFLAELNAIFEKFSSEGRLSVPHTTAVYWGYIL